MQTYSISDSAPWMNFPLPFDVLLPGLVKRREMERKVCIGEVVG